MFQHILVPLDGSPRAEQALPVAARIARASGGTLTLLRVVTHLIEVDLHPVQLSKRLELALEEDVAKANDYLAHVTSSDELRGINLRTEALTGPPAQTILLFADMQHVDLVVMCSHGETGIKGWILGSVAQKVARHSPAPVLVLREGGRALASPHPDGGGFLRALIPLDGSARAKAAIAPAAQLVAALSAPGRGALHLTRVVLLPEAEHIGYSEREEILQKAKKYLSSTVEHIREGLVASSVADLKLSITWSVTIDDDIAAGIIRVAENGEDAEGAGVFGRCGVIAMATHGYSGVQRWAMGSVTERVLHATRTPLLIVRPPDMKDKGHQTGDEAAVAEIQR